MEKKNRIIYIDIVRGIAILLMIIGHVVDFGTVRNIIFSFHMPLFIIISGYFYKERSLKDEIKNSFLHLFIPCVIIIFFVTLKQNLAFYDLTHSIIQSLKTIAIGWSFQLKITYKFYDIGVLWFVYMLIINKLVFNINKNITNNNEFTLAGIIFLETYLGYIFGISGYWFPWSIDIALSCLIFYYFGYLIKKYNLLNKIISNYDLIIIFLLLWIFGIKYNCIEIAVRKYPNGLWSFITAISGSIIMLKTSRIIETNTRLISKLLAWCGSNSLYILIGHYIDKTLIVYNFNILNKSLNILLVSSIRCIFSIVFAFICINIMKILNTIFIYFKDSL